MSDSNSSRYGSQNVPLNMLPHARREVEKFVRMIKATKDREHDSKEREKKQLTYLNDFSEVFELAEDEYFRKHPDPFDERAPYSIYPECLLGKLQKALSEYPDFLDNVVEDFIIKSTNDAINRAACRLLLLTLPGFEVQPTFHSFGQRLVPRLQAWAERAACDPLSSLAAGLLGLAMESSELVGDYKGINQCLVPVIISRLQEVVDLMSPVPQSPPAKRFRQSPTITHLLEVENSDSRSSFTSEAELRSTHRLNPLASSRKVVLYLQYLIPMGEYFEQLQSFIEKNVLATVLELLEMGDNIIKLETLKLLSSLLCHNKVALDYVNKNGIDSLISVKKNSRAGAAVAVCLYYLAYNSDVLERLVQVPAEKLSCVIDYALDLIETKHDSARVHAIMFFSYLLMSTKLQMLQLFEDKDGVRRIFNVISTLKILQNDSGQEQETHAEKTCCKMAAICLRRYVERNLVFKAEALAINTNSYQVDSNKQSVGNKRPIFYLAEKVNNVKAEGPKNPYIRRLVDLKAPRTLVRVALRAADWTGFAGRLETMRALLDVVAVCTFSHDAIFQLTLPIVSDSFMKSPGQPEPDPDELHPADDPRNTPVTLLFRIAEESEDDKHLFSESIRKSALFAIQAACCVSEKRRTSRQIMRVIQENHGIQTLIRLMEVPDLRVSAAIALAGIARLDQVKQIISKVLQPKNILRQFILSDSPDLDEFRKALDVLSAIPGMPQFNARTWDLDGPRKSEIVRNTRILLNQKEMLQLVEAHLREVGMTNTAEMLRKEGNILPAKVRSSDFKQPHQRQLVAQTMRDRSGSSGARIKFTRSNRSLKSLTFEKHMSAMRAQEEKDKELKGGGEEMLFSLSDAVRCYFRERWHSKCHNPISSVPRFSIFKQHRCPEKRPDPTPVGLPMRLRTRRVRPHRNGEKGSFYDKQFVWSRFKCTSSNIKTPPDQHATVTRLSTAENTLVIGGVNGDVLMYNTETDHNIAAYNCCDNAIINIAIRDKLLITTQRFGNAQTTLWSFPDMDMIEDFDDPTVYWAEFGNVTSDRLILTSDKEAILWDTNTTTPLLKLPLSEHGCGYEKNRSYFSPGDDQVLSDGCLWDLRSGKHITRFDKLNTAISGIFHPREPHVIINSEVWDIRMIKSNRLLKTIPEFDKIWPRFTPQGNAIFAAKWYSDMDSDLPEEDLFELDSVVKVLDSRDYQPLASWKFESNKSKVPRRRVFDFCMKKDETRVNILESDMTRHAQANNVTARWYSVGHLPDDDESEQEGDDDGRDDDDDDDDRSFGYDAADVEADFGFLREQDGRGMFRDDPFGWSPRTNTSHQRFPNDISPGRRSRSNQGSEFWGDEDDEGQWEDLPDGSDNSTVGMDMDDW